MIIDIIIIFNTLYKCVYLFMFNYIPACTDIVDRNIETKPYSLYTM